MPTQAEGLTAQSSPEEVQAKISSCISKMMEEGGKPQEQIIAICYSQARKSSGKELKQRSVTLGK